MLRQKAFFNAPKFTVKSTFTVLERIRNLETLQMENHIKVLNNQIGVIIYITVILGLASFT